MKITVIAVVLGLLVPYSTAAETRDSITELDRQAIRSTVEDQLAAFRADDAEEAFRYASPSVRSKFGTPQTFLTMVRQSFAPVYRPQTVDFRAVSVSEHGTVQVVELVDPRGRSFTALYFMERQPNGVWSISGCYLMPRKGVAI